MHNRTVALHNLGCKVNSYETEAVAERLKNEGYTIVPFAQGADVYIINTCSVTNIADRKSRQMIHRAKKMNPDAIVVAMGCYVQAKETSGGHDEAADIVIGNNRKKDIVEILRQYEENKLRLRAVDAIVKEKEYEGLNISSRGGQTRSFLKVQDGCDMFCSYCVIPYLRGRVRSREMTDAVNEARLLAENGCREVVLSGIHLSSYGRDLKNGTGLLELTEAIHEIEGISRIRLGSLEPGIITEEFAARLSALPKVCPHFHLSLQSGSDSILRAMNRRYDTEQYRNKCGIIAKYFDNPALTTDIIAGFPGESEDEFNETVEFVKSIPFFEFHVFPYSARKGTKAEKMPGQLTEAKKKQRASVLLEISLDKKQERLKSLIGSAREVLIEEEKEVDGSRFWVGHTVHYEKVMTRCEANIKNKLVDVKITGFDGGDYVIGEAVPLAL